MKDAPKAVVSSALLISTGVLILNSQIPFIHEQPLTLLLDHPLFVILLGGWYLGRPAIGMIAQWKHQKWRNELDPDEEPPSLSVIVPAYNEEDQVEEAVNHIFSQNYSGEIEIVIVDDGSTDRTWGVLQELSDEYDNVVVDTKENGGIGETQNHALHHCSNEVVVNIDADTHLEPNALQEMANVFRDEGTVAVGGNLGVLNPKDSAWTRVQTFEYSVAMELARMFQSRLKHLLCVSGGFGSFRTNELKDVGGWNEEDTISDDFELSIRMHEKGRVWFTPTAIALTDVPSTARGWWKQRIRWARNGLRTMVLHKDKQFSTDLNLAGIIGLPLKAFFSLAILFKVGQWGVQLATGRLAVGPSLLTAAISVMTITTPLALILLGLLTSYATNLRMLDHWIYIVLYATIYRPIHISVKVVGFIRAFIIEFRNLVEYAISDGEETTERLKGTEDN